MWICIAPCITGLLVPDLTAFPTFAHDTWFTSSLLHLVFLLYGMQELVYYDARDIADKGSGALSYRIKDLSDDGTTGFFAPFANKAA